MFALMGLMANASKMDVTEDNSDKVNEGEVEDLDWSPDQEILLLYSLNGYKPVGTVKYFNMFVIQERLSNAMNKPISSKAVWKKLNTMYDLEALDEAEAELSALEKVEIDFSLSENEFGELMSAKLSGKDLKIKVENVDEEDQHKNEGMEMLNETKIDTDTIEDIKDTSDTPQRFSAERGSKKEIVKRGAKKKDSILAKENTPVRKENAKKDSPNKNEVSKELKKGAAKEEDKKESVKKTPQDLKRDIIKDDKKEIPAKGNKRESAVKPSTEQVKKELELKKSEQKKTPNQRGGMVQARSETPKQTAAEVKRVDVKNLRSETPKLQRERKDVNSDKKKEIPDKTERKSPDSVRGSKLRARERKTMEPEVTTGTKRERTKDLTTEETPAKKAKIVTTKSRPTRNSIEPQQKPASPSPTPQKRRSRP